MLDRLLPDHSTDARAGSAPQLNFAPGQVSSQERGAAESRTFLGDGSRIGLAAHERFEREVSEPMKQKHTLGRMLAFLIIAVSWGWPATFYFDLPLSFCSDSTLSFFQSLCCAAEFDPSLRAKAPPGTESRPAGLYTKAALVGLFQRSNKSEINSEQSGLIASPEPGWPQWRGRRRDGISDETGLLPRWPDGGPKLLWKVGGLGQGWSSPIVVGNRLFITGDIDEQLVIFAFDTSGNLLWKTTNGRAWTGPYPGSRACCAYSEGRLYHSNAHGRVACLEATTGRELWALDMIERFRSRGITWGLSECLLVDGDHLILTPGGEKAFMVAIDKNSAEIKWLTPPIPDDFVSHASPILFRWGGKRLITTCSAGHAFGVDVDTGQLLWAQPMRNRFDTNVATPIFGDGCLFYVTPYTHLGRLYRLQPSEGSWRLEHLWTHPVDTVTGCGVFLDGVLYIGGYRQAKWWFAIDWKTGQTLGEFKDLTTGAAIYADGRLYVLDETGKVALLEVGRFGFRLVSQFRLPAQQRIRDAWAHPVICDGRLYLRYHDTLWCYDIQAAR